MTAINLSFKASQALYNNTKIKQTDNSIMLTHWP